MKEFDTKSVHGTYNHLHYQFTRIGTPRIHVKDLHRELSVLGMPAELERAFYAVEKRLGVTNPYLDLYKLFNELPLSLIVSPSQRATLNGLLATVFSDYIAHFKK